MNTNTTRLLAKAASVLTSGLLILAVPAIVAADDSKAPGDSERMTEQTWNAYNKSDNESAIQRAEACTREFRRTADTLQKVLKDKNEPIPPTGEVPDENQKKAIFSRGPLNDVATCLYLAGEAHARLAKSLTGDAKQELLQKARAAYEAAAKYLYARTWDPRGWFWDPSAKANERLEEMEPIGS